MPMRSVESERTRGPVVDLSVRTIRPVNIRNEFVARSGWECRATRVAWGGLGHDDWGGQQGGRACNAHVRGGTKALTASTGDSVRLSTLRYRGGVASFLEALDAETRLLSSELEL